MYEKVETCPTCESREFTNQLISTDHTVSGESFAIVECSSCHLWITSPRPISSELGRYYESAAYISHSNKANSPINLIYKLVRKYTLLKKTQLISKYTSQGSVLDYGCGTGDFLKACQSQGYNIMGIEPNKHARENAFEQTGIEIFETALR